MVYYNGSLLTASVKYGQTGVNLHDVGSYANYNVVRNGYAFNGLKTGGGTTIDKDNTTYALLNDNTTPSGNNTVTIYVQWIQTFTVTIARNNTSYGTTSVSSVTVPKGTTYSTSSSTLTFSNGSKVTATATSATGYNTSFSSWSSTSGTINAAATITANFSRSRNFTCASAGSNTTYMGKTWYTKSKSNGVCELVLNATVGSSSGNTYNASTGTGSGSVYDYIKGYSNGTNTIAQEVSAGLVTAYDSAGGTNSGLTSGVYWYSSGTVYDSSVRYKYTYNSKIGIVGGMKNNDILDVESGYFSVPSNTTQHSANTTVSVGNANAKITYSNATYTSQQYTVSGTNNKWSNQWHIWYGRPGASGASTSKVSMHLQTGNFSTSNVNDYNHTNKSIKGIICGGKYAGKTVTFSAKSTTKFHYNHGGSGTDEDYSYPSGATPVDTRLPLDGVYPMPDYTSAFRQFSFAGSVDSTVSNDVRTYNYSADSSCIVRYRYTIANVTPPIYYRPHIKVKT